MDNGKVTPIEKPLEYTLDGEEFTTSERRRRAADVLEQAGLDPSMYDLGELVGARPDPKRYSDDKVVVIRNGARFVSIRHAADVA